MKASLIPLSDALTLEADAFRRSAERAARVFRAATVNFPPVPRAEDLVVSAADVALSIRKDPLPWPT